jgi:2-oxo-4-hydroxy-4-carboxy--5-ureidoimidazoline (OHCU) decarboxylase
MLLVVKFNRKKRIQNEKKEDEEKSTGVVKRIATLCLSDGQSVESE